MAEALFVKTLEKRGGLREWNVSSAGTWGREGLPAAKNAIATMDNMGMKIQDHRSRIVTAELIKQNDLILTMEAGHKEALLSEFIGSKNKVFQFSEMIKLNFDIDDPIGQNYSKFEQTATQINRIIEEGFSRINNLAISEKFKK